MTAEVTIRRRIAARTLARAALTRVARRRAEGPYLKFRPVQLPLGPLELEAGPLVLDEVQDARHRVLRPLVLGVAVAAIVAAALVLVVGDGDIRAAGQLAVVILGRGAAAILHCKMIGHLHFMTRRPLQQLPFLRGVPRECSLVGQCISIGPSEKETIITHADASNTAAETPREDKSSSPELAHRRLARRAHVRATITSGKAEGIAVGTGNRFLSTAASASLLVDGSTGESYRAACLAIQPRAPCRPVRAHRRRIFALFIGTDAPTDSFTTPVAVARCGPFAKRDRPICFFGPCYAARYSPTSPPIGLSRFDVGQSALPLHRSQSLRDPREPIT